MPAKKKTAKPKRDQRRRATNAEAMVDQLAADLQRVLAERDGARRAGDLWSRKANELELELADTRRGREAWCHKAVELELRAEHAEEQLKLLLAGITASRPSVSHVGPEGPPPGSALAMPSREPAPTFGLPGDAPTTRFSREFRG